MVIDNLVIIIEDLIITITEDVVTRERYGNDRGRYNGGEQTEKLQQNNGTSESQEVVNGDDYKSLH